MNNEQFMQYLSLHREAIQELKEMENRATEVGYDN